jgi:hypothetical protein
MSLYRCVLGSRRGSLAGGKRNGAITRERQIAKFEQQIEKRDQVIGEMTVADRISKNSRDGTAERGDTLWDHGGTQPIASYAGTTLRSGANRRCAVSGEFYPKTGAAQANFPGFS